MSKPKKNNSLADTIAANVGQFRSDYEVADLRIGKIDEGTGKKIQLLDIDSLIEAPNDWDRFPHPGKEDYIQIKFSIINVGLINPIIVWDRGKGEKMILAGKTRRRIFRDIRDSDEGDPKIDYSKIPAIVYKKEEIDEARAKDIIVESNTEQRRDNTKDLPFVVQHKVDRVLNRKNRSGDTMVEVAKEMNMSRTKIYEERVLATEINENIRSLYYNGILNRKTVLRFKKIDYSAQGVVYDKLLKGMTKKQAKERNMSERTKNLRLGMSFDEIKECLTNDPEDMHTTISLRIPKSKEDEFIKMAEAWIENASE